MVEAQKSCAVADSTSQRYLAGRLERLFRGKEREPVAVSGQSILVTAVAAEDEAAELAFSLSSGKLRRAESEVESGANIRGVIRRAVVYSLPTGLAIKRFPLA